MQSVQAEKDGMSTSTMLTLLILWSALVGIVHADCGSCRYVAWNCSAPELFESHTSTKGMRSPSQDNSSPVEVCDAQGRIQIDDVFCDDHECQCASTKQCASLVIGCSNVFQARSRKRCISNETLHERFQQCARTQQLTALPSSNVQLDWMFFKHPTKCRSPDCRLVQQFHHCNVIQCGYLVTVWKNESELHLVVDGSRSSDMAAGTFHVQVPVVDGSLVCATATTDQLPANASDCYTLQTRNVYNSSSCHGVYLQYDTLLQHASNTNFLERYSLSKLSWPVWLAVVGSVCLALGAIATVVVVFRRQQATNEDQDDQDELLEQSLDDPDRHVSRSTKSRSLHELRQRAASPE